MSKARLSYRLVINPSTLRIVRAWTLFLLLLCAIGCGTPRVVIVRTYNSDGRDIFEMGKELRYKQGTGYVLKNGSVLTVEHVAPKVGQEVKIYTARSLFPITGRVINRWRGWALIQPERCLRSGDSGSPVFLDGVWVGSVEGIFY